jgi:two-component system nitrate/nitrite response regulator NarL
MTKPNARPQPLPPAPEIAPREAAILDLVAEGLTDKAIGGRLGLAHGSVRNRLTQIYRKLRVASRTEAALRWRGRPGASR